VRRASAENDPRCTTGQPTAGRRFPDLRARAPYDFPVTAFAELDTDAAVLDGDRTLADDPPKSRVASKARTAAVIALPPKRRRCTTCGHEFPSEFVVCPRDATPLGLAKVHEDPLIGAVLAGTYRLVRVLGKGGMGRLYEAEHARLGRRFAVKVLHESHADKADAARRFEREAQALARIRSDHVLDVVDVLRTPDSRTAIVTTLLEGEDLQARLERCGRLPAREAIEIARQICRGLSAAHAVNVIHRDLKPSNLFLTATADGTLSVKILDFGVAKLGGESDVTRTGVVLGTPAYMAPEQARGSSKADARSDVYAVGAVLYRALTGRMPYDEKDAAATLAQLLHDAPKRPRAIQPDIPLALETIVQRAMARDPDERPASALELEAMLGGISGEPSRPEAALSRRGQRDVDTLVLANGSVARAGEIELHAKRARPRALLSAVLATLTCGAAGTLAMAAPLTLASAGGPSHQELALALAIVGALAGGGSAATMMTRSLGPRWASAPEVDHAREHIDRVLGRGLLAFGALFAAVLASSALGLAAMPSLPTLTLIAVVLGALVAAVPVAARARS
jgi:serine/threonine protein kinase